MSATPALFAFTAPGGGLIRYANYGSRSGSGLRGSRLRGIGFHSLRRALATQPRLCSGGRALPSSRSRGDASWRSSRVTWRSLAGAGVRSLELKQRRAQLLTVYPHLLPGHGQGLPLGFRLPVVRARRGERTLPAAENRPTGRPGRAPDRPERPWPRRPRATVANAASGGEDPLDRPSTAMFQAQLAPAARTGSDRMAGPVRVFRANHGPRSSEAERRAPLPIRQGSENGPPDFWPTCRRTTAPTSAGTSGRSCSRGTGMACWCMSSFCASDPPHNGGRPVRR